MFYPYQIEDVKNSSDPLFLEKMSVHEDYKIKETVAENVNTPKHVLEILSNSKIYHISRAAKSTLLNK